MGVLARITRTGVQDRYIELIAGEQKFGADLSCTVVLMDPQIASEHFHLNLTDDALFVTLCAGAEAQLNDTALIPEQQIQMAEKDLLRVGDLTIEFQGGPVHARPVHIPIPEVEVEAVEYPVPVPWEDPAQEQLAKMGWHIQGIKIAAQGAVVASIVLVCQMVWSLLSDENVTNANIVAPQQTQLVARVVEESTFVMDETLQAGTAQTSEPVISNLQMQNAAKMVLSAIDSDAHVSDLSDGVLQIQGIPSDDPRKASISRTILADVPGLTRVEFDVEFTARIDAMREQIAGVWAGKRPYVVRTDGKIIRPTQVIHDGAILTEIMPDRIHVMIDDRLQEVAFQ